MTTLIQKYKRELLAHYNWRAMADNPSHVESDEEDNPIGYNFLGSLINPSGKYYLPFACSNLDSCANCNGTGRAKKLHTCAQCHGEGKRKYADIAAITGESIEDVKTRLADHPTLTPIDNDYFTCASCNGTGKESSPCRQCGGLGSHEAYQDQEWQAALDAIAERFGGWIEAGEGDPCDTFFCVHVAEAEEVAE